jgi:hypothetical protein
LERRGVEIVLRGLQTWGEKACVQIYSGSKGARLMEVQLKLQNNNCCRKFVFKWNFCRGLTLHLQGTTATHG